MLASRAGLHHTHFNTPPWTSQQPGCKSRVFRKTGWFCGWFRWTLWSHPPWWRGAGPGGWCRRAWAWPGARCRGAADTPSRRRSLQREGEREGEHQQDIEDIPSTAEEVSHLQHVVLCASWQRGDAGFTKERSCSGIRTEWHYSRAVLCLSTHSSAPSQLSACLALS